METIDFNEVIRDPETISVVGGLLQTEQFANKIFNLSSYNANIKIKKVLNSVGWYRICELDKSTNSFILNISKSWVSGQPASNLLYIACTSGGDTAAFKIKQLAGSLITQGVDRIRVTNEGQSINYIDIHYSQDIGNIVICSFAAFTNIENKGLETIIKDFIQVEESPSLVVQEMVFTNMM